MARRSTRTRAPSYAAAVTASFEARRNRLRRAGWQPSESIPTVDNQSFGGVSEGGDPEQPISYGSIRAPQARVVAVGLHQLPIRIGEISVLAPLSRTVAVGIARNALIDGSASLSAPTPVMTASGTRTINAIAGTASVRSPFSAVVSDGRQTTADSTADFSVEFSYEFGNAP